MVVKHTNVMRFMTHVHVTKSLPDAKYKQNPNKTVLNRVLRLMETPYDTLWCQYKASWISWYCCLGHVCSNHRMHEMCRYNNYIIILNPLLIKLLLNVYDVSSVFKGKNPKVKYETCQTRHLHQPKLNSMQTGSLLEAPTHKVDFLCQPRDLCFLWHWESCIHIKQEWWMTSPIS